MQGGPHVEICLLAIQFLGTYVIVIKLAYGSVHHGYIELTSKGMDFEVLMEIANSDT